MFLFANERRDGAVRLLRTPFEKHLYADYLTKHPEKAEAFSLFWAVQSKQLLDGLKAHYGTEISEAGAEGMRKLLEIAKEKIEFNKCEACGSRLPRMWTKVTPEVMAKDAAMEETYFFAYRYATLLIHPTVMGVDHQLHNPPQLPNMLLHVRTIVMRTVVLQWEWFRKSKTITGTAAVALNALSRAFAEPTTPLR